MTMNQGVTQGKVLGPLNILLHVNNFSAKLEGKIDVVEFVDDTIIVWKMERN